MDTRWGADDFDLARFTSDVGAVANILWADSGLPAVLIDRERRLIAFNAAAEPSLSDEQVKPGGRLEESLRQVWLDDEVAECDPIRHPLRRAFAGETIRRQMIRFNTVSYQEQGRMRVSALPVTLLDGGRGLMLCWHEFTEPMLNQRRDRREIRRLEQLLDGASDYVILSLAGNGEVQSWSRSAQTLLGYSAREAVGLPYAALFAQENNEHTEHRKHTEHRRHTETPPAAGGSIAQARLDEVLTLGSVRTDGLRRRKDGSTFWAEGALTLLKDDAGDPSGFVEVLHDVTDKHQAELEIRFLNDRLATVNQQLEERIRERTEQLVRQAADLKAANSELESFSYTVSHNLRSPLRAVAGYARLIEDEFPAELPAGVLAYLTKLNDNAVLMGRLIDGLLELSRNQRIALRIEKLEMTALVQRCWTGLQAKRSGRVVVLDCADLPAAEGDHRLIQRVWTNLLQNAITYTGDRDDARVEVSAEIRDGVTWYRVQDNGVGFEMKYAHKIGEVFQRLHDGSQFPGTGIGMAGVQRIVQRHGGTVTVHGEVGVGARIEFSLWARD